VSGTINAGAIRPTLGGEHQMTIDTNFFLFFDSRELQHNH